MEITLQEFLRRKGAIGMLSLLHERPRTYSEIEPEIEVTSDTIITRRDEAAELGLLNISLGEAETGTKKVYHLTEMGEFVTDKMAREGLISNYRKMRTLEELVDEQTDALVNWVVENPSQLLQFEEAQDGTILRDSRSARTSSSGQENSDIAQEGGEGTTVESNISDDTLDHAEPPTERDNTDESENEGSSENTGAEEDGAETELTDENNDTERATRPSDRTSSSISSKDPSNLKQGSLSETAREDSNTESDDDDSGSES